MVAERLQMWYNIYRKKGGHNPMDIKRNIYRYAIFATAFVVIAGMTTVTQTSNAITPDEINSKEITETIKIKKKTAIPVVVNDNKSYYINKTAAVHDLSNVVLRSLSENEKMSKAINQFDRIEKEKKEYDKKFKEEKKIIAENKEKEKEEFEEKNVTSADLEQVEVQEPVTVTTYYYEVPEEVVYYEEAVEPEESETSKDTGSQGTADPEEPKDSDNSDNDDSSSEKNNGLYMNPIIDDGWNKSSHLTSWSGVYYGPSGKETYYNLNMSGVVNIMRGMGFSEEEYPYWVRDDGCKMLGDYIMVAANLDLRSRGSLVETSLGTGLVCDTGGFAYGNRTQLDIATNW